MKNLKDKANRIVERCRFKEETGNETYRNRFYLSDNGTLYNIQYKNGRLHDVICYGK